MGVNVVYGPGGFDPQAPQSNAVEVEEVPELALDGLGAAMTLLAVKGLLTTDEAAAAVGLRPADLVAEAEAWAVAASLAQSD